MPTPIYIKATLWIAYFLSLYFVIFWLLVFIDKEYRNKLRKFKKYPLVSIVVPAYNEGKNILTTLKPLINLDYPLKKLEIIVVNDGSTDNTKNIVKKFIAQNKDHNIKLVSQPNKGKGAALNKGLHISKGEFFVCLDADSIVESDVLRTMLPHFTDKNIAVVLPSLKAYKPSNFWQKMQWFEYIVNMFYKKLMSRLDCLHVSPGPFSIYRKDILQKIGGFDENNLTEDLEVTLRLQSKHYRIVQIMNAEVYTITPNTFKSLYRQRNRWYKGAIINAIKYKKMIFNKKYGDFGFIQMPTIVIFGFLAIVLFASMIYYGLKPYIKYIYNSVLIDFDFYTLIKEFKLNFNILEPNYKLILIALVTLSISIFVLIKSHREVKERSSKYGALYLITYLYFYFFVMGIVWIGIMLDFAFRKNQKW